MIDKLDIRVPAPVPYTREFSAIYVDLRNDPKGPFHAAQHYEAVADLRNYGYEAILHTHCKHGRGDHKIELIDAGARPFDFLTHEIRQIFEANASGLELIRVDLATDVHGLPVPWFLSHARAKFKRFHSAGTSGFDYQQLGMKGIQTLYLGKRPNLFRIYDKVAEYRHQYQRLKRSSSPAVSVPTFESCFGISADATVSRVERQIGGGKIPESLRTVGELRRNACEFDPFSKLELTRAGTEPQPADFNRVNDYLAVMQARELLKHWGKHAFFQWLNEYTNRNARRWWNKFGLYLTDSSGITSAELYERYRDSVSKQIAA